MREVRQGNAATRGRDGSLASGDSGAWTARQVETAQRNQALAECIRTLPRSTNGPCDCTAKRDYSSDNHHRSLHSDPIHTNCLPEFQWSDVASRISGYTPARGPDRGPQLGHLALASSGMQQNASSPYAVMMSRCACGLPGLEASMSTGRQAFTDPKGPGKTVYRVLAAQPLNYRREPVWPDRLPVAGVRN